jgi:hypothetical protein
MSLTLASAASVAIDVSVYQEMQPVLLSMSLTLASAASVVVDVSVYQATQQIYCLACRECTVIGVRLRSRPDSLVCSSECPLE